MRREKIDDDVWEHVVQKYGRYGDKWCGALRRGLGIPIPRKTSIKARNAGSERGGRKRFAKIRLDRKTTDKEIAFRFGDGPWKTWSLPSDKKNAQEVRRIREEALDFGKVNGATDGQLNAIGKAFSDAGYYLNRKQGWPASRARAMQERAIGTAMCLPIR